MTALLLTVGVALLVNPLPASQPLVGAKYQNSPLGEGEGTDADPRFRTDAFDCLTFVETVMAMTLNPESPQSTLDQIRYGRDVISYGERNHVMEAQWLPNNIEKGFLKDVTLKYGGDVVVGSEKVLGDAQWNSDEGRHLGLKRSQQPRGSFHLNLIPAVHALDRLKVAPDGTVVVVVRADRPHRVTRISHIGFLVRKKNELFLRHASRSFGKVVDERLNHYLKRNLDYGKWTVEGFSLFQVEAAP